MPGERFSLAPKGQLMMKHTTAVLLGILLSVALFASSCEARGLGVHGSKGRSSSRSSSHQPDKDAAKTSLKADNNGWGTRQTEARSTVQTAIHDHLMAQADAKGKEGVAIASSTTAATVGATPVRVSQRLSRRDDTGFHLDYAGPRTHTPSHN